MALAMDNPGIEINGEAVDIITSRVTEYLGTKDPAVKAELAETIYDGLRDAHRAQSDRGDALEGFGSGLEEFNEGNIEEYMKALDADLERMLKGELNG